MRRYLILVTSCLIIVLAQCSGIAKPEKGGPKGPSANEARYRIAATDGFSSMPDGASVYGFGWVDITGVKDRRIYRYRHRAEQIGPLIEVSEGQPVYITLTNIGLLMRPDLDDPHTIHWHGFPNQIPIYDGVPEQSIAVPVGREFVYYYEPLDPGTYMYHCHTEPAEHIQMGMVGPLIVRPAIEEELGGKFVFNDPESWFDREYMVFVTEIDSSLHGAIEIAQEPDWSDYDADYWLLNGRAYPDTMLPANALEYQPVSARIECNAGERVLLRFMHLGFEQHSLQLLGIPMKVVGMDAQPLRGIHGEDLSYWTNTVYMGAGKTFEVLFDAPDAPGEYPFYNRNYSKQRDGGPGYGGMLSSVIVHPRRTLRRQRGIGQ